MQTLNNKSLLVIEPDPSLGRGISHALREMFSEIQHIENPIKAVSKLETNKFDVIICEICFKTIAGIPLIRLLRRKAPDSTILVLTSDMNQNIIAALAQCNVIVIEKPLNIKKLKSCLSKVNMCKP